MIELIIVAVVLIIIMLVFVFILFDNIIKKMDENAKKYFVNKMHAYDYILEEKRDELKEIKNEITYAKESNKNILKLKEDNEEEQKETNEENYKKNITFEPETIKYNLDVPEYRETQFFNNYKEVRKVFAVNNEKIIKDFIAEHKSPKEEKEYKELKNVRDKFSEQTIYEILTLNVEEQIKILEDALTDKEKKLVNFDKYNEGKNFNIRKFIKSIDNKMEQIEPTIYVYSNNANNHYEEIDKNIISMKYNNMSEGIIIKYRNRIYDYSI